MAYRNKIFCTLNTKPSLFLFSCTRPGKNRGCSSLQQKCLTKVRDAKWNREHKAGPKNMKQEHKKVVLCLINNFFLWLLKKKKVTLKQKAFFLQEQNMCPEIFQPSIMYRISPTWWTEKLYFFLQQQKGLRDRTRVMKFLCEIPRGGKMDSPGKTDLRVLQ